jgi:hypothetical protein
MSFFEPPPPPEPPEPPRIVERPWWQAPRNELGVSTSLRLMLARTENVAVALLDAVAYSTGLSFTLVVLQRAASEPFLGEPDPFEHPFGHFRPRRYAEELPPELLRFGVEFSDGRKATTLGWGGSVAFFGADTEAEPEDPVLSQRGGSGGDGNWESSFWLWPLPPPGPLAFVVEWPAKGIELTRHEVDAEPLLEASSRSEMLWPAPPPSGGGAWTSY